MRVDQVTHRTSHIWISGLNIDRENASGRFTLPQMSLLHYIRQSLSEEPYIATHHCQKGRITGGRRWQKNHSVGSDRQQFSRRQLPRQIFASMMYPIILMSDGSLYVGNVRAESEAAAINRSGSASWLVSKMLKSGRIM